MGLTATVAGCTTSIVLVDSPDLQCSFIYAHTPVVRVTTSVGDADHLKWIFMLNDSVPSTSIYNYIHGTWATIKSS